MKKAFSLLLALALTLIMGIGVYAADPAAQEVDGGLDEIPMPLENNLLGAKSLVYVSEGLVNIDQGELFLVMDDRIVEPEMLLEPDSEYTMDVYYADADVTNFDVTSSVAANTDLKPLTENDLKITGSNTNAKLRLRSGKGTSVIASAKLDTTGVGASKRYQVKFETKDLYNTKQTEVEYRLVITGTPDNASLQAGGEGTVAFLVGHGIMDDDDVDSYGEGDTVTISNDTPIWTKKQIERLVEANNYKAITLEHEDGSWTYEGRMNGMGDTNFYTTQDVIPSIMNKYDQDFKFLILPAGVTFPTNGEMRIDVSDVSDDWDRVYTYLYRNGKLTRINTTYDSQDDMIVFRTNYLGAFVMTPVEITDTTVLEQPTEVSPAPSPAPGTGVGGTNNPNTGIPAGMNLIVGLGSLYLLTAGTVILRKRK